MRFWYAWRTAGVRAARRALPTLLTPKAREWNSIRALAFAPLTPKAWECNCICALSFLPLTPKAWEWNSIYMLLLLRLWRRRPRNGIVYALFRLRLWRRRPRNGIPALSFTPLTPKACAWNISNKTSSITRALPTTRLWPPLVGRDHYSLLLLLLL